MYKSQEHVVYSVLNGTILHIKTVSITEEKGGKKPGSAFTKILTTLLRLLQYKSVKIFAFFFITIKVLQLDT